MIAVFASTLFMVGCDERTLVSPATLEEQKVIARDNLMFNAKAFRANDPRVANFQIVPNGDSSQLPECPQGDGWGTLTLVDMSNNRSVKIKCPTYSAATACMYDEEFQKKSYAADDGRCQPTTKVPYPLPKVAT